MSENETISIQLIYTKTKAILRCHHRNFDSVRSVERRWRKHCEKSLKTVIKNMQQIPV
jgi:hypothetical protein